MEFFCKLGEETQSRLRGSKSPMSHFFFFFFFFVQTSPELGSVTWPLCHSHMDLCTPSSPQTHSNSRETKTKQPHSQVCSKCKWKISPLKALRNEFSNWWNKDLCWWGKVWNFFPYKKRYEIYPGWQFYITHTNKPWLKVIFARLILI